MNLHFALGQREFRRGHPRKNDQMMWFRGLGRRPLARSLRPPCGLSRGDRVDLSSSPTAEVMTHIQQLVI